jgi:transcriptional regulator with XRE-family HTH domain
MTETKEKAQTPVKRESTRKLLSQLFATKNLAAFMKKYKEALLTPAFPEYLAELCESRGIRRAELCQRVEIERAFAHQIFTGRRRPPRDYIFKIAIGLGLSVDECQRMLAIAKRAALYPRIPRDAAILHCLHHKLSYAQTQDVLFEHGLSTLGEGS